MKLKLKSENEFEKAAMKVSAVSIVANVLLSAFKLLAGILASSGAMVSDAIHSASDVISTVVVIIGIRLSGKASDKEHPYGHERMECVRRFWHLRDWASAIQPSQKFYLEIMGNSQCRACSRLWQRSCRLR